MDERIEKWLYDIKKAIEEVELFTKDIDLKNITTYQTELIIKRAIERELEIIGESMNRIVKRDANYTNIIPEANSIIGLRNHLIHAYDNISDENILSILVTHLPKLKEQVNVLLK